MRIPANTPLVGPTTIDMEVREVTVLRVMSKRVFRLRFGLGMMLLKLGFWVMGSKAEAIE